MECAEFVFLATARWLRLAAFPSSSVCFSFMIPVLQTLGMSRMKGGRKDGWKGGKNDDYKGGYIDGWMGWWVTWWVGGLMMGG